MIRLVSRTLLSLTLAAALGLVASTASAGPIVSGGTVASGNYTVTDTTTGLSSLDHHYLYTWQIEGLASIGANSVLTGASLTFNNFRNWTSVALDPNNILWMHLLDTAAHVSLGSGNYADDAERVASFLDVAGSSTVGLAQIHDNFYENTLHNQSGWLVPTVGVCTTPGSTNAGSNPTNACTDRGDTTLANTTNAADSGVPNYSNSGLPGPFGTAGSTWTYNFTSTQLNALRGYINSGNDIAIGLDSDCHFFDDSVVLGYSVTTPSNNVVPEPTTLMLMGTGIAGLLRRRKTRSAK
jgi:hypothetical protein